MGLTSSLDVSPYFDDFDEDKNYYKVLFKPTVAVQARELNQLSTILQHQIEKFGDNIFKRGTVIDGCNVTLHSYFPYVKIKDIETDGAQVNVKNYENLYLKNSANLTAFVVTSVAGYETRAPDLNTLYVRYNNSGADGNTTVFSANDILTVFDTTYPIFKYKITDGSSGFANTDSVVITSAISIQNSSGGTEFAPGAFTVNDVINNGVANAIIVEANTTANTEALVLKIKPVPGDLKTANNLLWKFANNETIINLDTANSAIITGIIGYGAEGTLSTDSLGKITSITPVNSGSGYYVEPHVSVAITTPGSGISNNDISQLNVIAQNYLTNITVANNAMAPVGTGYGITVAEGWIFQKGYFSKVSPQLAIVNKYSNTLFSKSVGFYTTEEIINSNQDPSLLDNATGSPNETAPGADRLKLMPTLNVLEKTDADANSEFMPIVEFADGVPFKNTQQTVYNIIGDEIAKRTFEESGNYVLNQFLLTTKDSTVFSETADVFKMLIDPGKAYINGYRIETTDNYSANVAKGKDVINNQNATIRIGYGNYIKINQLGGIFQFNFGDVVDLYDTAKTYISSTPGSAIAPAGNKIGSARMRSLLLDSGEPGSPNAEYRLYLFDIVMDSGKNFGSVKSVFYNGTTFDGIADIVLDSGIATLKDSAGSSLLFKSADAVKEANGVTYTYRTQNLSLTANSFGYIRIAPPGGSEYFPYAYGNLSTVAKRDLLVIPLGDYQSSTNADGTITTSATSEVVAGSGGMNFLSEFRPGDHVKFANNTTSFIRQVSQVSNSSSLVLTANAGTTLTGNAVLYFPNNVPISITNRDSRVVTLEANGQLTINLDTGMANATSGSSTSANVGVVFNVTANNVTPNAKSVRREIYARISVANNADGVSGPWALGISDVFRLRNVYKRSNGSSNVIIEFNSNTDIDNSGDYITIQGNPYANGDTVKYTSNAAVITGLANNTNYYVVEANSSTLSLSATRGGSKIAIAPIADDTHKLEGPPFYFAGDTNGVTDVTNDFYIDNNHKEDYLDTSYLYQKPRTVPLNSDDVLLVKFDAFDTTTVGVRTVKSYPINDSINLASLSNTAIHTMEIPEMVGLGGKYYDLRDQFDFRPTSANTIEYTADYSNTAIVNPGEPTDSARFNSTEQKFPVPDTNLSANVTYYVGRNDRVVLDKNGYFTVLAGVPDVTDAYPPEPEDSITLQILEIPPYPSLPMALSSDMAQIIDTKIANETYSRRKDLYKISAPIDVDQRIRIQTKNYTMADIATLERRIKDLEYYVSFTLAETVAKMRFIPSSNDPTLDRFKFGFFVDPFTSYNFADSSNPEFYSTIENDQLFPKMAEFNLAFEFYDGQEGQVIVTPPFVEQPIIEQPEATDGPVANTSNTVVANTAVLQPKIMQVSTSVLERYRNRASSRTAPYIYDTYYYTASTTAGPMEYYNRHSGWLNATEVLQSPNPNGPWTTILTSAAAQGVKNDDLRRINWRLSISDPNPFSVPHQGVIQRDSFGPFGNFIKDHHKLTWLHNPNNGQYYMIRVYKGGRDDPYNLGEGAQFEFMLFYPTDSTLTSSGNVLPSPYVASSYTNSFVYNGVVTNVNPPSFQMVMSMKNAVQHVGVMPEVGSVYIADAQKFVITATGLKPDTYHRFIFAGTDETSKCQQIRATTRNLTGLMTDNIGSLMFEFYYDAGVTEAKTNLQQQNRLMSAAAGIKNFSLTNTDNTSKASGVIDIKYYSNL